MNLRHKKPINSYRGQANNDKNEFNDDDFKHQPSSSKRFGNPSGEQMYKYSKILAKFISNSNQFYRQSLRTGKRTKTEIEKALEESKLMQDENSNICNSRRKEQLRQRKNNPKIQCANLQPKQSEQKSIYKSVNSKQHVKETIKHDQENLAPTNQTAKPLFNSFQKNPPMQVKNDPFNNTAAQSKQRIPENLLPQIPPNLATLYNPNMPPANFPGGVNGLFPNNGRQMSEQQMYQQMLKMAMIQKMIQQQKKGYGGNGMAGINPQMMMNPMLMNMNRNMYLNNMIPPQLFMNGFNQNIMKPAPPIYNLTEVFLEKRQPLFYDDKVRPNKIVKRANYHIGLAYHIYMSQHEKKTQVEKRMSNIDPTKKSKQIKQRQMTERKMNKKIKK